MEKVKLSHRSIAKNTMFLYFRMAFVLLITLYTSRIVLNELGVVDFGIYTLVAGFVTMFTFFGSSLSNAAQRFLNYRYGLQDQDGANHVFNMGFFNFFVLSIIVVLILETFGLWYLNNKLVIPPDRLAIVNLVFHISVFSVFVTINNYIYRATLIARENMAVYAYTGVFEAIARLLIAFLLIRTGMDKLLLYSFLYMIVSVIVCFVYVIYCSKSYNECKLKFYWNLDLFKEMSSFIGWNAFTSLIEIINQQGITVLLNLFFGPIVNAARGIAFQISNALLSFSHNIYMAARPQIVKAYAVKDMRFFIRTIELSSKLTYFLLLVLSIPLIINIEYILDLWLIDVPEYSSIFSVLIIIYTLVDSLKNPLWAAAQAVGDLRRYSLIGGIIFILNFPISYFLMKIGFSPYWVYIIYIFIRVVYLTSIIFVINNMIYDFNITKYFSSVILPIVLVTISAPIIPLIFSNIFVIDNFLTFLIFCFISTISTGLFIYAIGLNNNERLELKSLVNQKIKINYNG